MAKEESAENSELNEYAHSRNLICF